MTQFDRYVVAAMFALTCGISVTALVEVDKVAAQTAENVRVRQEALEKFGAWMSRFDRFDRRLIQVETFLKWPRFAKHCSKCEQCGGEDVDKTLCEEGFELLQADMKAGAEK